MILQESRAGVAWAEIAGELQLVHEQKYLGRTFRNDRNAPRGRHSTRCCGCKCLDTVLKSCIPLPRPPPHPAASLCRGRCAGGGGWLWPALPAGRTRRRCHHLARREGVRPGQAMENRPGTGATFWVWKGDFQKAPGSRAAREPARLAPPKDTEITRRFQNHSSYKQPKHPGRSGVPAPAAAASTPAPVGLPSTATVLTPRRLPDPGGYPPHPPARRHASHSRTHACQQPCQGLSAPNRDSTGRGNKAASPLCNSLFPT